VPSHKDNLKKKDELKRLLKSLRSACDKTNGFKGSKIVFGEGPAPCGLMIIGEAPGRDETKFGHPFVGRAGRFLISVLKEVFGRERDDFYITNVVKVWPTIETKRLKTRTPTKEEEGFFLPCLLKEIRIVEPRAIVAVGKTAFSNLAPDEDFTPGVWVSAGGRLIMPVYHPAYLLRKQKDLEKNTRELKAALRRVKAKLEKG